MSKCIIMFLKNNNSYTTWSKTTVYFHTPVYISYIALVFTVHQFVYLCVHTLSHSSRLCTSKNPMIHFQNNLCICHNSLMFFIQPSMNFKLIQERVAVASDTRASVTSSSSSWGIPRHQKRDMQSLQPVLGLPLGLLSVGCGWNTS